MRKRREGSGKKIKELAYNHFLLKEKIWKVLVESKTAGWINIASQLITMK